MKNLILLLCLAACFGLAGQTKIPASAFEARAVSNYDGDNLTFKMLDSTGKVTGEKFVVRIAGLDTPERFKPGICKKEQPWAKEAKEALAGIVSGVGLTGGKMWIDTLDDRDKYSRLVARVWYSIGGQPALDITYQMLRGGHAWYVYNADLPKKSRAAYSTAFKLAKMEGAGLFNPDFDAPVDPRKWKKKYGTKFIFNGIGD